MEACAPDWYLKQSYNETPIGSPEEWEERHYKGDIVTMPAWAFKGD